MTNPEPAKDCSSSEFTRKPIRIQRKRLGAISSIAANGEYGFIDVEDFREDVFFHRTVWQSFTATGQEEPGTDESGRERPRQERPRQDRPRQDAKLLSQELAGMFVEFELDDEVFSTEKKLRAKVVRPTTRPRGRKLSGRDATFSIVTHHPKARRKKPRWRK